MCGLVGLITKNHHGFTKEQVSAFDNLLYVDALRGMDSTGVFVIDKDGNMDLAKEASPAFDYRQDKAYDDLCTIAFRRGRAMIGHNRAATKGEVIDENAHPFVVDDRITLVHNGTLWGDFKKLTDQKVDVDSHAIAHKIHECGDDVEAAMQQLDGAYALIWHDFQKNTLNFVRNNQRPLNFVETDNGWMWASEANMLEWILARYKWKALKPVTELGAGILVTYDFSNQSWKLDHKNIKLEAPRKSYPVTQYAHRTPVWGMGGHQGYMNEDWDGTEDYMFPVTQAPACAIPQQQQQHPIHGEARMRAVFTGRAVANEEKLAETWAMSITAEEFANSSEVTAADGTWVMATCIDFETVHHSSAEFGYYIYAQLDSSPDYLVKWFVDQGTYSDSDLLNMTMNQESREFHIVSRQWRAYQNGKVANGYGLLNARESRVVINVVKENDNA